MHMTSRTPRLAPLRLLPLALIALSLPAAPAQAADEKKACIASYEQAQQLRSESKLRAAREQLLVCARDVCPAALKGDCVTWLGEVDSSIPSVVVDAKDKAGKETINIKVSIDGKTIAEKLDGKSIQVDPGVHTFKYELAGASPIEEQVVIRQGEKNRRLTISFAPKESATPAASSSAPSGTSGDGVILDSDKAASSPYLGYALAGVGVLGVGAGAFFWLTGKSAENKLRDQNCKPACSQDEVDSIKTKYLIGDIAMGVGVVAIGVGTVLILTSGSSSSSSSSSASASRLPTVDVRPLPGGGFAGLSGQF
jgi:hypothetical protein